MLPMQRAALHSHLWAREQIKGSRNEGGEMCCAYSECSGCCIDNCMSSRLWQES